MEIEVEINDYGYSGEGVGKVDGKVCFVPYCLKGERVKAEVKQNNSKLLRCTLSQILLPSPFRQTPPCPYFSVCGGCSFQHTDYKTELEIKKEIVLRQLKKVDFFDPVVISSKNEYGYRNKIKLFCLDNHLALFQASSDHLVKIDSCLLANAHINQILRSVQKFLSSKNIGKYISQIIIRSQNNFGLVLFEFSKPTKVDFEGLQNDLGQNCGIYISVKNGKNLHISGIKSIQTAEFGLDCAFRPSDFHQVNDEVSQKLYEKVTQLVKGDQVINGYSGCGVLSGILAKKAKKVFAIELGKSEHQSAQYLKEKNGLDNLVNINGDCAKYIPSLLEKHDCTVVVDPPRAGLDKKVCDAINKSNPKQVIYISCNISTLVRDILRMKNYRVSQAYVFDMFSKTSSVEMLCELVKK